VHADVVRPPSHHSTGGTAERAAEVLRDRITEGYYRPAPACPKRRSAPSLKVSRNTLREAFRLLMPRTPAVPQPYEACRSES